MSDAKEKIVLNWEPKWPSVKNLGGALKVFVDDEYSSWRWAQAEDFAEPVHVVAHVQEWPYHFVVDFLQRLPVLLKLTGFASIEVLGPPAPSELTDEQWHGETLRVLRSLNGPETWISQNGDSILSKKCITNVIEELHKRAFPAKVEPTSVDSRAEEAARFNAVEMLGRSQLFNHAGAFPRKEP